jgi:hypothetical protein
MAYINKCYVCDSFYTYITNHWIGLDTYYIKLHCSNNHTGKSVVLNKNEIH